MGLLSLAIIVVVLLGYYVCFYELIFLEAHLILKSIAKRDLFGVLILVAFI